MPSTVAGFLIPEAAVIPLYGDALEDVFSATTQGILGIADGSTIRPRWQQEPPDQPDFQSSWISFGVVSMQGDWNAYQYMDATLDGGLGATTFERDEELTLLYSFYGPNATATQNAHQDGLLIEQNRDLLNANGIKLVYLADSVNVPALLKGTWVKKVDQRAVFRRRIRRQFAIRYFLSANVILDNEKYITNIVVKNPP